MQHDPAAVFAWLSNADQEEDRELVMMLGWALARSSPEIAAQIARQMSNTQGRNNMLGKCVRELARLYPLRAVAQLNSLTGSERRVAVGRIAMKWTKSDPRAALE